MTKLRIKKQNCQSQRNRCLSYYIGVITKIPSQDCKQFFVDGVSPIGVKQQSKEQYYSKYALSYSEINYGNLWSAEHLTKDQMLATNQMKRYGRFDSSNQIIKNYCNSGYDRGHMTPSGDMPDVHHNNKPLFGKM